MNVSSQSHKVFMLDNDNYLSNASWVVSAMIYDLCAPISDNSKVDVLTLDEKSSDSSYAFIEMLIDNLYTVNSIMFDSMKGRIIVSFTINAIDNLISKKGSIDTSDEYTISNSIAAILKTFCGDQDVISVLPGTLSWCSSSNDSEYILDKVNNRMMAIIDDEFYDMYSVRNLTTWVCAYIHQNIFEDYDNIIGDIEIEVASHKMVDILKYEMFPAHDISVATSKLYRVMQSFKTGDDPYNHIIATIDVPTGDTSMNETWEDGCLTFPTKREVVEIMEDLAEGGSLIHRSMMEIKFDFPYVVWGWFKKIVPITPRMYTVMQIMSWVAPVTNAYTGKLPGDERETILRWRSNLDRLDPRLPMIAAKFINRRVENRGGVPAPKKLIITILKTCQKIKKDYIPGITQGNGNSQARWIKKTLKNENINFLGQFRQIKERVYNSKLQIEEDVWVEKWVPFYDSDGNKTPISVLKGNDANTNIMNHAEYMLDKYVSEDAWYHPGHIDESVVEDDGAVMTTLSL